MKYLLARRIKWSYSWMFMRLNALMILLKCWGDWKIRGMCTWMLKCSYPCMPSWSHACMFTCFINNLFTFVFALMIICSHIYLFWWSHAPMFTCFDVHMLLCSHASIIVCSHIYVLWWSHAKLPMSLHAHVLGCFGDYLLLCSNILMISCSHVWYPYTCTHRWRHKWSCCSTYLC